MVRNSAITHRYDSPLLVDDSDGDLHVPITSHGPSHEFPGLKGDVQVVADVTRHDDVREAQTERHRYVSEGHVMGIVLT